MQGGTTAGQCPMHRRAGAPNGVPGWHERDARRVSTAGPALRGVIPRPYGPRASRRKAPDRPPVARVATLSPADTGRAVVLPPHLPENRRSPCGAMSLVWHGTEASEPMDARPRDRVAGGAVYPERCPRPRPHGSGAAARRLGGRCGAPPAAPEPASSAHHTLLTVPSREAEPLHELGRDHGDEAGCIEARHGRCGAAER